MMGERTKCPNCRHVQDISSYRDALVECDDCGRVYSLCVNITSDDKEED